MKKTSLIVIFIIGILLFSMHIFGIPFKDHDNILNSEDPGSKPEVEAKYDLDYNVLPDTVFRFETRYIECGHVESYELTPPEHTLGTKITDLQHIYPEWNLGNYSQTAVIFYKYEDGLCPKHFFLGIRDGYVTIFYDKPSDNAIIKEITEIKAELLRSDDRELLEKGIEVYGEGELMKYIEGLTS
ncbi:MAG TPA: hypothetical protein GX526_02155 [Thermoanaerobacterales bacterium]|nr:hypothetical protein [Thermoanaerobacterales bacterium]